MPLVGDQVGDAQRLLRFSRELQAATDVEALIAVVQAEIQKSIGYRSVWLYVLDESLDEARLVKRVGAHEGATSAEPFRVKISGDAMIAELLEGDHVVVIDDAQTDPRTNKKIVVEMGNRTIVLVPLRLVDKPLGALGIGTFGSEGVRAPTTSELSYVVGMASQLSVALARIRFIEEHARRESEKREGERKLLQAQKLESLGLLAGSVAHDFNNLLTVILGSTQVVLLGTLTDVQRGVLDAVVDAAERARALTRRLLALGGAQALDLRSIDMNEKLREARPLVSRFLPPSVALEVIEEPGLPRVDADPSQIDQVLMNLCINARDAMPKGGRLTLQTDSVTLAGRGDPRIGPAGQFVRVTVRDTGSGMPREVVDHIFEPFFTTKRAGEGSGLGLAIAYGIASQHRGILRCTSEVGVGTTFELLLPAPLAA